MTAHAAPGASRLRVVARTQDLAAGFLGSMRDVICALVRK